MKNTNFKKFIILWLSEFISSIGGGLTSFGLGVYVFSQTGSVANMALVTLLGFLPTVLLSVPAGVLADKYDRRLLMMIGDGFSGLGILFILICMINGGASLSQICVGVFISSVFSSLLEPSYKATITDLLTKEEFSKANGLVSFAGSSRYLFSPIIAGFLLTFASINLILIIDIFTFFITILTIAILRKNIRTIKAKNTDGFFKNLKEGCEILHKNKGLLVLILISSLITLFMGIFQVLVEPMILSFADAKILGIVETICACGMLASGIFLGIFGIRKNYVNILGISLVIAGLFMTGFGFSENILLIMIFGFGFFMTLPFANNCLDYLTRTNIPNDIQGRIWGIVGFISQFGYIIAYAISGILADAIGNYFDLGVGKGSAIIIQFSGIFLALIALSIFFVKSVKNLEFKES